MPTLTFIIVALTLAALGSLAIGTGLSLLHRTQEKAQQTYLDVLRKRTSWLLLACEPLLAGDTPEDTILYQRFSAHGGEYYDNIRVEVREALLDSQEALDAAFELHRKLSEATAQNNRPPLKQVEDWETLYAVLIGCDEHFYNLTADELRVLLDPMLSLHRHTPPTQLAEPLNNLLREMTDKPLQVEWQQIHPDRLNATGVLGYIKQVKEQIDLLPALHKDQAAWYLLEADNRRQAAKAKTPHSIDDLFQPIAEAGATSPPLTEETLFAPVDERLDDANKELDQGNYLEAIQESQALLSDIEVLSAFLTALSDCDRQRTVIDAITAQGYHPLHLDDDLLEIKVDLQNISKRLLKQDYIGATPWIEELKADNDRASACAQAWQTLHQQNSAELQTLDREAAELEKYWVEDAMPAWQTLQTYPEPNWQDLAGNMEQVTAIVQNFRTEQLDQIARLNDLSSQHLAEAEQLLAYAAADLAQAVNQSHIVANRLSILQTAKANLPDALRLTEAELKRAKVLCDREDTKIEAVVDRQIEQAEYKLSQARQLTEAGNYLAAIEVQSEARQLATAAHASANLQVREISTLQGQLEEVIQQAREGVDQCLSAAGELPAPMQTENINDLGWQLRSSLSKAEHARAAVANLEDRALSQGLRTAIAAYANVQHLSEKVLHQIAVDRQTYEVRLADTLVAISDAGESIKSAERTILNVTADNAARHALQRAKNALPSVEATQNAARDALDRMCQQAKSAQSHAKVAASLARRDMRQAQTRDPLRQPASPGDTYSQLQRLNEEAEYFRSSRE